MLVAEAADFGFWSSWWWVVKAVLWLLLVGVTVLAIGAAVYFVGWCVSTMGDRLSGWWDVREGRRILSDEFTVVNARLAESIEFAARLEPADAADFYGSIDARDEFIRRAQEAIKSNMAVIQGQGA